MIDRHVSALVPSFPTRRQMLMGTAFALTSVSLTAFRATAQHQQGISHSAESIHQEPVFKAGRNRVYDALTDAQQFEKIVQLSAAMQSMQGVKNVVEIVGAPGGEFSLFGGYITGRNIELVPSERVVQAWRAQSWGVGIYSVARFELVEQGAGTKIIFDHTGFPVGQAEHLAQGWRANYWEPIAKVLAA
jgi:activator of HSP90 ATPase